LAASFRTRTIEDLWYNNLVPLREECMAITASEARKNLFPLIKKVNDDRVPVEIVSKHGRAYLVAADDYEPMAETDYLLRSPVNASVLSAAVEDLRQGRALVPKAMGELWDMAGQGARG
jgi:antitoxin YefM